MTGARTKSWSNRSRFLWPSTRNSLTISPNAIMAALPRTGFNPGVPRSRGARSHQSLPLSINLVRPTKTASAK